MYYLKVISVVEEADGSRRLKAEVRHFHRLIGTLYIKDSVPCLCEIEYSSEGYQILSDWHFPGEGCRMEDLVKQLLQKYAASVPRLVTVHDDKYGWVDYSITMDLFLHQVNSVNYLVENITYEEALKRINGVYEEFISVQNIVRGFGKISPLKEKRA